MRDSLPIDMLLSALSFLVVAQSSSEVPEGLMNNPVVIAGLQTASSAYFQRKILLSGFSAYSDGWPYQLVRISGVVLHS